MDDERRSGRFFESFRFKNLCCISIMIVLIVLFASVTMYFINTWLDPLSESFKEQNAILADNSVNWRKKCIDETTRASWEGYDNCNKHREVLDSYYLWEVLKLYAKKMTPCGKDGCFNVSMNPVSWLAFVLPMSIGIGGILWVIMVGLVIIGINNMLMRRYEMPMFNPKNASDYHTQYYPPRQSLT
jgi:hypothetical protein